MDVRTVRLRAYLIATAAAAIAMLGSFLLRMPLRIRWVNRTVGFIMLLFLLFSLVEITNVKAVTPFVSIPLAIMGGIVAGIGFQVGWPNTLIMVNNLILGGIVAIVTAIDAGRGIYYSDVFRSGPPVDSE